MADYYQQVGGASEDAEESDPIASSEDIQAYIDSLFSQLGELTEDEGDIPETASVRPRGDFMDFQDMLDYLEDGALVIYGADGIVPNPIIWILKYFEETNQQYRYVVYIEKDTP